MPETGADWMPRAPLLVMADPKRTVGQRRKNGRGTPSTVVASGKGSAIPTTTAAVLGRLNSQEDTRGTRFGDHDPNKYWTENPNSLRSHPSTNHVDANRRASRPNGHP
jgi:hypothetical protein